MTDNEIIKALECCGKNPPICHECKYKGKCNRIDCYYYLKRDALDLINRLKAENEGLTDKLEKWLDRYNEQCIEIVKLNHAVQATKSEARKEFAERLKEKQEYYETSEGYQSFIVDVKDIDNLSKEMG